MTRFFLILEKALVKGEPAAEAPLPGLVTNAFAFRGGRWESIRSSEINDCLLGFDPTDDFGFSMGHTDIMEEIREISEAEAAEWLNRYTGKDEFEICNGILRFVPAEPDGFKREVE